MSLELYAAYLLACVIVVLVPGPTATLVIANSLKHGPRAGLLNVLGTQIGLAIMIGIVGIGLTSMIEAMGHWFDWVRLAGAAYLIWLGWKMIRGAGEGVEGSAVPAPRGGFLLQGALVALSNPKTLLFFGAFFPQFIDPARDHGFQILIMGVTAMAFAAVVDGAYALAAGRAGRMLSARRVRLMSRVSGGFLIGGGLWLALSAAEDQLDFRQPGEANMAKEFDLVVRGGTVADGTGAALHEADIALKDGKIAAVGKVLGSAAEEIDARGLLVTPGFVDIHTHYDGQATWDSHLQPSSWHGVTTAVMGNCGVGFAPVKVEDRRRLIELMEGVEDIPGAALDEGLNWSWESFGQYLDALEARPRDMDLGAQLPHGALRVFVMGERAAKLEEATPAEVARMRALTSEAMRDGALGFSTSRTLNHRTVKGDPTPSLRASEAELLGIALGMKDAGRGVIEFISDFNTPNPESEFEMIDRLLTASGRPFSVSLAQGHTKPEGWRRLLGLVEGLAAKGHSAKAQVAPRPIGVLQGLQASRTPFSMCRSYKSIQHKSVAERLAIMRDPAFREKLLAEAHEPLRSDMAARLTDYDRMFPLGDPPDYEPAQDSSLGVRARREGRDPRDVIYDYLIEGEGKNFIFSPFANFAAYNLDCCREMMQSPHTLIGLGDGGAHVGLISDGSFPTSLLSHWGRDRASGRLDVSWLVKRQTSDNARAVGLNDRGRVAPGYKADLNVIDFDKLRVEAPVMKWDLPAGGKRLLQKARGYRATIVSGAVTYRDGEATGALPGRLVRGPQAA